jgi:hypothetical protein
VCVCECEREREKIEQEKEGRKSGREKDGRATARDQVLCTRNTRKYSTEHMYMHKQAEANAHKRSVHFLYASVVSNEEKWSRKCSPAVAAPA